MDVKPHSPLPVSNHAARQATPHAERSPPPAAPVSAPAAGPDEEPRESLRDFGWFLTKLIVVVLAIRVLLVSPFSIPSESMAPQLWNGDTLLAVKWPYGYSRNSLPFDWPLAQGRVFSKEPRRGDVVIFKHPIDNTDYVKRVVGLPGDTIALTQGRVVLNGEMLPRERLSDFAVPLSANTVCAWGGREARRDDGTAICRYTRYRETLPSERDYDVLDFGPTPGDVLAPVRVPAGHMFVLGDSRDNSRDSRFAARSGDAVGIVHQDSLVGRAAIIMWSSDGSADWARPWTWFTAARFDRIGTRL